LRRIDIAAGRDHRRTRRDEEDRGMADGIYLRPTGILWGDVAAEARREGEALPLAGAKAAFLGAELIEGAPGAAMRTFRTARDLAASGDAAIARLLGCIEAPRPAMAGIVFDRTRLMGIVNITPDSFSDGGDFLEADRAAAHAQRLVEEGAEIVDFGGESTRPGSLEVPLEQERERVLPVLDRLEDLPATISVDTRKAALMKEAVEVGADFVNDVSALTHDPESARVVAALGCPVILMHSRGDPRTMQDAPYYDDVLLEVYSYLEGRIEAAVAAGIDREMIVIDPGIGFGKTLDHNLALLAGLSLFHGLGAPILLGASRKRIIGSITGKRDPKERMPGSLAVALAGAAQGVQILRVHDVAETRQALDVWRAAVLGAGV
jgi:dihydropteroate synthase